VPFLPPSTKENPSEKRHRLAAGRLTHHKKSTNSRQNKGNAMNTLNTTSAIDIISTLDLGAIKTKLMHVASGEGWSSDHADAIEVEYRRFLTLMKLYPNDSTAPLVDVDTFWHYHILDTAKYAADCEQAFGYFLHHYPYLGMDGTEDAATRDLAGARMAELYAATFGATMQAAPAAWCGAAAPEAKSATAWCGAATAQPAVAWCGAAAPAAAATAWCGAAAPKQATAWCGAAQPVSVQVGDGITLTAMQAA
jgi:hypothetical protein